MSCTDFPSTGLIPNVTTHTVGNITYIWTGIAWESQVNIPSGELEGLLVNDLSQAYIFDTVADYQASTVVFPVGKTIHLKDRGADFTVIAGVTGGGYVTIPSTSVNQSIDLQHDRATLNLLKVGYIADGATLNDAAVNAAQRFMIDTFGGGELLYPLGVGLFGRGIRMDNFDQESGTYIGTDKNVRIIHSGVSRRGTILRPSTPVNGLFTAFPEWNTAMPTYSGELDHSGIGVDINTMTLDMNYNNIADGGAAFGDHYDTYGTLPDGSSSPSIWAADNFQYPVYAFRNKDVKVSNCDIRQSWYNGVEIFRTFEAKVFNCLIENCGDKASYLGNYSAVEVDNGSSDIDIYGNTILNCGHALVSNGGPIETNDRAVENLRFHNNVCKDITNSGIDAFDWLDDWKIHDNTFERMGLDAIRILFTNSQASTKTDRHPKNISIYDNEIIRFNETNAASRIGIRLTGNGFKVHDNTLRMTRTSITADVQGVFVNTATSTLAAGEAAYCTVSDNQLMGRFQGATNGVAMLNIGIDNSIVQNNVLKSADGVCQLAARVDASNVTYDGNKEIGTFLNNSGKRPFILVAGSTNEFYSTEYGVRADAETTIGQGTLTGENTAIISEQINTDIRGNISGTLFTADYDGVYNFKGDMRVTGDGSNIAAYIKFGGSNLGIMSRDVLAVDTLHVDIDKFLLAGQSVSFRATSGGTYSINTGSRFQVKQVRHKS